MPRKVFIAGEILTAADVNTNLMDQAVMSFAGTAARGSAIPSPVEGMTTYLEDSNILSIYDGSAWKTSLGVTGGILQVVSTTKTDTFSTTSSSFTDVTGLTATITPRSSSSKILVTASVVFSDNGSGGIGLVTLAREGTNLIVPTSPGSRSGAFGQAYNQGGTNNVMSSSYTILDAPATTSAVTYAVRVSSGASETFYVNRSVLDTDAADVIRGNSFLTVMEVAG